MPDNYHAFVDKSRRKPYVCGICGRDILDPYHQPTLTGTAPVIARRDDEDEAAPIFEPEPEPMQMALF